MKKIIITGATSMIGVALTEVAVREGTEVFAIVRPDTHRSERIIASPLVHTVYVSLESLSNDPTAESLPTNCDVFYHFAWVGTGKATRDDPSVQVKNIQYTLDAVKLAERCGCHRFVGAGSQAEYGTVDGVIDENTRFAPITSYGIAKYAAGILSKKLCKKKGIEHLWGRVFSVYGPHDNEGTMLNYAIDCFNKGEVAKFSSGRQFWNYLYESDAGEMFYRLGEDSVNSGTYFIANEESHPLRKFIDILMKNYGVKAKAEFDVRETGTYGLNVDMKNNRNALCYKPYVSFEDGINKMISSRSCTPPPQTVRKRS